MRCSISGTWIYFHDVINDINFNNCSDFHWQTFGRMAMAMAMASRGIDS